MRETPQMETLEFGTLVCLKSGGPTMTVNGRADTGEMLCGFFDSEGKFQTIRAFSGALKQMGQGKEDEKTKDA